MERNSSAAWNKNTDVAFRADEIVVVAGELVAFEKETNTDPDKIDSAAEMLLFKYCGQV